MKVKQIIAEALSPVVYHYTGIRAARNILQSGQFELSSALGSVESEYSRKEYNYFLSTTRTRRGSYHDIVGSAAALFVLDGNWYNNRYPADPVDYWQNRDPSKFSGRESEAEDRLFSKKPAIPTTGVTAVHILVKPDASSERKAEAREALIAAKNRGIKTYLYNDEDAWRNFDTRNLGDISALTGKERTGGYVSTDKGWLLPLVQVIKATKKEQLDKKALELRYSLIYDRNQKDIAKRLATDLSNARKPDASPDRKHLVNIVDYMNRNGLNTLDELVAHLSKKWQNEAKSSQ